VTEQPFTEPPDPLLEFIRDRQDEDELSWLPSHDPMRARILRDIEAGRAILLAYERSGRAIGAGLSKDIRALLVARAAIWQDHPGYAAAVAS